MSENNGGNDDDDEVPSVPERGRLGLRPRFRTTQRVRYLRQRRAVWIPELLQRVIKLNGLSDAVLEQYLDVYWAEIVGDRVAQRARAKSLRDGVLKIGARSSVWVHELQLRKSQLLEAINRWLESQHAWLGPKAVISDIKFGLDDGRHTIADPAHVRRLYERAMRKLRAAERQPPPVSEGDRDRILAEAARIEDAALRAVVEELRTTWGV